MSKDENTRHAADFGENQRDGREGETERKGGSSHNEDDNRSKTGGNGTPTEKQMRNAKRTMGKAVRLRLNYPEVWKGIEAHALGVASKGQRVRVQYLLECSAQKDYIDPHGSDLSITNDCAAVFARWLIADHPELAAYIKTGRSVFDGLAVPLNPETGKPAYRYFAELARLYG